MFCEWYEYTISFPLASVIILTAVAPRKERFLGVFTKLRKATNSFFMSVRPSVRTEQHSSHWTHSHEI